MKTASIYAKCVLAVATVALGAAVVIPADAGAPNGHGEAQSLPAVDLTNPFFQSLGINGRTCQSCHDPDAGWTITPTLMQDAFDNTNGATPPLGVGVPAHYAETFDTGTCQGDPIGTVNERRDTFEPVLERAVTRGSNTVSATGEFEIVEKVDPFDCPTADFLHYRRPNPTVNEKFRPTITWTGSAPSNVAVLKGLFNGATQFHARASGTTGAQQQAAADLMFGTVQAQIIDKDAGPLDAAGAQGGPAHLSTQPFFLGINDPGSPGFDPNVFDIYDAWETFAGDESGNQSRRDKARGAIFRGQEIFNFLEFEISGVNGLNDVLGIPVIQGTCSTCHNAPNVGGNSVVGFMDIGTADKGQRHSDMTMITVENKATGEEREVTDLGRARVTEKWDDIGKFNVPVLRALAARLPGLFHDATAKDIKEVVQFYKQRFKMDIEGNEVDDLVAFLAAL